MGSEAVTTAELLPCFLMSREKLGNESFRWILRRRNAGLVPQTAWPSWCSVFLGHSLNFLGLGEKEEER